MTNSDKHAKHREKMETMRNGNVQNVCKVYGMYVICIFIYIWYLDKAMSAMSEVFVGDHLVVEFDFMSPNQLDAWMNVPW